MNESKVKNFELALRRLQEFVKQGAKDDMDKAGLIQAFEFTYEQAWKSIQKLGGSEFVNIASPKAAFSWAMDKGWIQQIEEPLWLEIMKARNLTSHTYNQSLADKVADKISSHYVNAFTDLYSKIQKS